VDNAEVGSYAVRCRRSLHWRFARWGENDFRRFLLAECLEAYANLDAAPGMARNADQDNRLSTKPLPCAMRQ